MAVAMQTEDFPYLPSGLAEVNKMIKEHGDLFSDSQCKVCSAVLISESQKLTHYQSKKHANKVRRYFSLQNEKEQAVKKVKSSPDTDCNNGDTDRFKKCHICDMTFSSPVVAESHYQGKVHAKNLRLIPGVASQTPPSQTPPTVQPKKKPAEDLSSVTVTGGNNNNNGNPDRFCSICQASFNNPLMAQQHYVGKKHRKQMTKLKLMETYGPSTAPASTLKGYPCTICSIELNSVEQYQSHISGAKHKNQVKKSGPKTAENQEAAEQSFSGDAVGENQYSNTPAEEQYAAEEGEAYTGEGEAYTGEGEAYTGESEAYTGEGEVYTAGGEQYAPEDTEYSEECQYT